MLTTPKHGKLSRCNSSEPSKNLIMEYENYNYRFRSIQEIFPHRETWKKAFKDASSMDREYIDNALEKYQELQEMLYSDNSSELKDLSKYQAMCDLAIETCQQYLEADRFSDKSHVLERLESLEGGLAVMFDLLAGIRSREWTLADIRHEQALMYFGEYLAVVYTYFRKLPTWQNGPLSKMSCTTIEKNSSHPWGRELLRQFSEQERIPLETVEEIIRLYGERCRLAHPDNMIRQFVGSGLWAELESQFEADRKALLSRGLLINHELDFQKALRLFKEVIFADAPMIDPLAGGGDHKSASVLSWKARIEIQEEMEVMAAIQRELQMLERKRENRQMGLLKQSLAPPKKTQIHDDMQMSEFWGAFESDPQ